MNRLPRIGAACVRRRALGLAVVLCCLSAFLPCLFAQEPEKRAVLRWYGQSFFQLETSFGKKVVFDPHAIEAFGRPEVAADFVLVSHPHNDHNRVEMLSTKAPRVFEGIKVVGKAGAKTEWNAVDEKISDGRIRVRNVGLYHDATNGMQRGKNSAWVVEADGLRFVHLGDLGHLLSEEQAKAIGPVDVLMVPVGGIFTLNGDQAKSVVEQLKPRLFVVPMHYGVPGFDDLVGPDEFLDGFKDVQKLKGNELPIPLDAKPDAPTVVQMGWQKPDPMPPAKK